MTYEDMERLETFLRAVADIPHGKDGQHYQHSLPDWHHDEALRLLNVVVEAPTDQFPKKKGTK